jgi:hypothetical protein
MKQLSKDTIIVGPVRFSYMNVFKPKANDLKEGKLELSVRLLLPKDAHKFQPEPKKEGKGISDTVKTVLAEKFPTVPAVWRNPLRDGDTELNDQTGESKHPGYWFLQATTTPEYPPVLIDSNRLPVEDGWQSGDWGYVKLRFYAYDTKGNKGVSAALQAIQFAYHDEPFGTVTDPVSVAKEFDVIPDGDTGAPRSDDGGHDPFAD